MTQFPPCLFVVDDEPAVLELVARFPRPLMFEESPKLGFGGTP